VGFCCLIFGLAIEKLGDDETRADSLPLPWWNITFERTQWGRCENAQICFSAQAGTSASAVQNIYLLLWHHRTDALASAPAATSKYPLLTQYPAAELRSLADD
jgi:hypothetical protein